MVVFGLITKNKDARKGVLEVKQNLLINDFLLNPFVGKIKTINQDCYIVDITPLYPPVFYFSIFPFLIPLIWGFNAWGITGFIMGLIMFSLIIFWNPYLYYLLFVIKTKRGVSYLGKKEVIKRLL